MSKSSEKCFDCKKAYRTFGFVLMLLNGSHLVFSTMSVLVVVTIKYEPVMSKTSDFFGNYANFT